MLETNEKLDSFIKEILELKIQKLKKRNLSNQGSTAEWRGKREVSVTVTIKLPKTNTENGLEKKINSVQGTCGTVTKDLTFMSSQPWKERRKSRVEEILE